MSENQIESARIAMGNQKGHPENSKSLNNFWTPGWLEKASNGRKTNICKEGVILFIFYHRIQSI